jgi:hypothetical protein
MLKLTQQTKIDPIFAAIDTHRRTTGARYIILEALCGMKDDAAERGVTQDAHDKAADVEIVATKKLRKTVPTTIAGVTAMTTYFVEYTDHYPDCPWITERKNWDDPHWFEHAMIRNLAAALATTAARMSSCTSRPWKKPA